MGCTKISEQDYLSSIDEDQLAETLKELEISGFDIQEFAGHIPEMMNWLEENGRKYPWRDTLDPWKVYVAEILLQRTRADTVSGVYPKFVEKYPSPESIDQSNEEELRDIISELGFVNHRVKSLKSAGEIFVSEYEGKVPETLEGLKKPWRSGNYVARATQLFARGETQALVDPNIVRVIENKMNVKLPSQPHKKGEVYSFMESITPEDAEKARAFYLALLDLGALEFD
ncbi:MAG: hypothetical protein ABEJ83_01665 [Candidatus Nanohaloarchaea archaeon]